MFLTKKHINLLYEISDVHYECFQKFYSEYGIKYSDVLQLNHKKMIDIIGSESPIFSKISVTLVKRYTS